MEDAVDIQVEDVGKEIIEVAYSDGKLLCLWLFG